MAILSLLFNKPKKTKLQTLGEDGLERELMIIDATTEISHNNEAQLTDNPVEDGSNVSDHMELQPKEIQMQGVMSEAPITITQAIFNGVGGIVSTIGDIGGGLFTGAVATLGGKLLSEQGNRVQDALNTMLEIQEKKIPVTIITGLRGYENMFLTSFTPIENAENGQSLVFSATFKQITIVSSDVVILPVEAASVAASASKKQNGGKKVANEASDQVSDKGSTILKNITDSLGLTGS